MTQFQLSLFILILEILFILIKSKPEIEGMVIFDYKYLYSAYADDTTFYLRDIISINHMVDTFYLFFSYFSGLKPNLTISEVAGSGVQKRVQVTVCGIYCINPNIDMSKILVTSKRKIFDIVRYSMSLENTKMKSLH